MLSSSRRKIGVLLLAAVLMAPLTAVAEPHALSDQQGSRSDWDFLAYLWNVVTVSWGDNGCSMDPYGLDNGCSMDPFGRSAENNATPEPAERMDNGCSVDPYGSCRSGS